MNCGLFFSCLSFEYLYCTTGWPSYVHTCTCRLQSCTYRYDGGTTYMCIHVYHHRSLTAVSGWNFQTISHDKRFQHVNSLQKRSFRPTATTIRATPQKTNLFLKQRTLQQFSCTDSFVWGRDQHFQRQPRNGRVAFHKRFCQCTRPCIHQYFNSFPTCVEMGKQFNTHNPQ